LTASWKAHSGSVWKVTWAHPEFGQVIATCSFDRTAAIWEEISKYRNNYDFKIVSLIEFNVNINNRTILTVDFF